MNKITNVRLHTPLFQDYQEVCAILSSLGFNNHHNTFMETSDYIKRRGLNKPQFLLKRKKL